MSAGTQGIGPTDAAAVKALLAEEEAEIRRAHAAGAGGSEIVQRRTALIDRVLRGLYQRWSGEPGMPLLIAVGGYGRGELNPYSDIDLLFLAEREQDRDRASPFLYALWDIGLDIGYSVRTPRECIDLARDDGKIRTSLLESRHIAGDPSRYAAYEELLRREVLYRKPDRFVEEKLAERAAVRLKYGGSLYLREPNIKESAGGLRDFHTARWIALTVFRASSFSRLLQLNIVTAGQLAVFLRSRNFLWRIRNELHFLSGRKNDHLTFDLQDAAAADFRFRSSRQLLAVERFMKAYFIHARAIMEFSRRIAEQATREPRRPWIERTRTFGPFAVVGRTLAIAVKEPARPGADELFEAFLLRQTRGVRFSEGLADLLRRCRFDDEARRSKKAAESFLALLDNPANLADTLTLMRDLRFLGRYLPEFRAIEALARHDYHHTYTVDEHVLTAVRNLENVWQGSYPALHTLFDAFRAVRRRWVLLLAVLLHDLGKAHRERHEVRGREIAARVLDRLGVPPDERDRVLFLIENHLVMATLAQRRELSDGGVIAGFAETVGDLDNLNMLYLLTYADLSAVSPTSWSAWKAALLQDLYSRTRGHFQRAGQGSEGRERGHAPAERLREAVRGRFTEQEIDEFVSAMPGPYLHAASTDRMLLHLGLIRRLPGERQIIEHRHRPDRGYTELTVCAYDAYGMFYRTAGAIAEQGLNILRAQVFTARNGIMIDTFQITDEQGNFTGDAHVWDATIAGLRETLLTGRRPPDRGAGVYPRRQYGTVAPSVEFDNDLSPNFTIIDVTARDRIGLLCRIAQALYDLNLDVASAKIVTEGIRALDAFYVTDLLRQKITDPVRLESIRGRLLQALSPA